MSNKINFEKKRKSKYFPLFWKIASTVGAVIILIILYYRNIIAFAFVNGEAISFADTIYLLRTGYSPEVRNEFLTEKLIEIEAKKRGVVVTSEEVEGDILRIKNELAAQGRTLTDVLNDNGQSIEDFQRNVRTHLTIYKLMSENIEITPEEIDKYIEENDYIYAPNERKEIESDVQKLLFQEKVSEKYNKWINEVKAGSEIDYIINTKS